MEENEGTKTCPNCNRDIPAVNYVTHSLHCVRNIKICPVCKEPVLLTELEEHNDKLHQLVPCKQCGERVRGTDMEDHTRDSCAFTLQACRFCSLDIRRRDVPSHERYCGARTERCADCGEYVQLRYRQLHLESNHGFVRLNDDPFPRPGMRSSDVPSPSQHPANTRARFPSCYLFNDFTPFHTAESLRSRCRRNQEEEDARINAQLDGFNLLADLGIQIPDFDDEPYVRPNAAREPARNAAGPIALVQNGFGQNVFAPDVVDENAEIEALRQSILQRYSYVGSDAVEQNEGRRRGVRRNVLGRNVTANRSTEAQAVVDQNARLSAIRRNLFASNLFVNINATAPDILIGQNGVRREPVRRAVFGSIVVIARNVPVPARNASESDAGRRNTDAPNESRETIAQNETTRPAQNVDTTTRSDVVGQNVQAPDVQNTQGQDASGQNVGAADVAELNAAAPDVVADEAGARDAAAEDRALDSILAATPEMEPIVMSASRARPKRVIQKRTNDQPQINTAVAAQDKVVKMLGTRSAVKKRPAPAAPATSPVVSVPGPSPAAPALAAPSPAPNPRRDLPYYSALQRRQDEDRQRQEQTAYNLSIGLPPVLDPAAKLEKLRKMDALHNRESEAPDYRERLQGRVWRDNSLPAGHVVGRGPVNTDRNNITSPAGLADLQPMSPEQFMQRFNELQLIKEPRDIRSSLRELRRGLNEVTAPYNNSASHNNNNNTNKNNNIIDSSLDQILIDTLITDDIDRLDEARALEPPIPSMADMPSPEADVMVPCEFCCQPLRASDILEHERACVAGLAFVRGLTASAPEPRVRRPRPESPIALPAPPAAPAAPAAPAPPADDDIPVIPCEFCTETLPFYLINEHQELCGRESQLLYPD